MIVESIQYNTKFAIKGAIRDSSREKLYQELGFESLHDRRLYRKLLKLVFIIKFGIIIVQYIYPNFFLL